ncbi:unnamed protein product [Ectocarpus sp. 4 AP-2014]
MLSADGRRELGYTWSDIKMHAAPVWGWLPRDPIVGCDPYPNPIHPHTVFVGVMMKAATASTVTPLKDLEEPSPATTEKFSG